MSKSTNSNETIWHLWNLNAEKYPDKDAIIFWQAGEDPYRWTFSELILAVEKYAVWLKNKGIKPHEVCGLIFSHNKEFYPVYLAVVSIGAVPSILAYPNKRIHPEKFISRLQGIAQNSGLDWVLTEKDLESMLHPLVYIEGSTIKGMNFPFEIQNNLQVSGKDIQELLKLRQEINSESPALLQHSSGAADLQKPVLLSNKAVLNQIKNYSEMIRTTGQDKIVSWLPLYHDMGLIAAFHLPLALGISTIHIDPFQWTITPVVLLNAITKERATLCWMPNFAFNFMASKIKEEELKSITLESMRMFINCSEPVKNDSAERFFIRFAGKGLKENAISTCYGMAETTFAVTQTPPGIKPEKIIVDKEELKKGNVKIIEDKNSGKILLSSGRIMKGCKLRIVSEKNIDLDEAEIGEIVINSESMFEGYRNYPEKTNEALKNNWYYSGDLGFMYKDNLYVLGRKDDLIISAGNNIFPDEVEYAINDVVGIIPGRTVAFGEFDEDFGSEHISVIVETESNYGQDSKEQNKLKTRIIKAGMDADFTIKKVYFVPPRWLTKDSSGKLSRKDNKKRILDNEKIVWDK